MNLTNIKIESIKRKVAQGTGKYGPWTLHIVKLDDPDWKDIELSFFEDKNTKVFPEEGMEYTLLEIEEGPKGYVLRKLTSMEKEKPKPDRSKVQRGRGGGSAQPSENPISMYTSYAKDVAVAIIAAGKGDFEGWIQAIASAGIYLKNASEGKASGLPSSLGPPPEEKEPPEGTILVKNVTPLVKLMCSKVVGWSMKSHEEAARGILPKGMTPDRYNLIQEFLSNAEVVEDGNLVAELARIVKECPVKER